MNGGGEHSQQPREVTSVGAEQAGITVGLVREFAPWPYPESEPSSWASNPFSGFTRAPDGRLLPYDEPERDLPWGLAFGFLPRPLGARNVIRGTPYRPAK